MSGVRPQKEILEQRNKLIRKYYGIDSFLQQNPGYALENSLRGKMLVFWMGVIQLNWVLGLPEDDESGALG